MPLPIPPPEEAELRSLYLDKGLSVYAVGKKYDVDSATVKKWLRGYQIQQRTKEEQEALTREKARNAQPTKLAVIEPEFVDNEESESAGRAIEISGGAALADQDDDTIWSQLSGTQIEAVYLLASQEPDDINLTDEERATKIGVHVNTLKRWKKEPIFRECLEELHKAEWVGELKMISRTDLINRIRNGTASKEERINAFKLTGDLLPENTVVQVGIQVKDGQTKRFY